MCLSKLVPLNNKFGVDKMEKIGENRKKSHVIEDVHENRENPLENGKKMKIEPLFNLKVETS
jgi:hypothetical protein